MKWWRKDSFQNLITGLGAFGRDKRLAVEATGPSFFTEQTLAALFDGDTLARKMVLKPIQAELRNWIEFSNLEADQYDATVSYIATNQIRDKLKTVRVWEDVFGGGALFLGLQDGQDPRMPVREDAIKSIDYIIPLDRYHVRILSRDTDLSSTRFGEPLYYEIRPHAEDDSLSVATVHASRMILFPGPMSTNQARRQRDGWGVSTYELAWERLTDASGAFSSAAITLQQFTQVVWRMKGLADALAAGKSNALRTRLSAIDEARSVVNALLLDADNEEWEIKTANVSGMAELIDRIMLLCAEAADIPVAILFGRSPAGLNATGQSDMQQWHERINDQQEDRLRPRLEKLFRYMFLAQDGPTGGVEPDDWEFRFRPLQRPDQATEAQTHLTQAQADGIYLANGVVSPDEIRDSRFGSDEFSTHTTLLEDTTFEDLIRNAQSSQAVPAAQSTDSIPDRDSSTD